ncbi:cell division protein SepF [Streptococcus gallolyticus]|nr:cell division protein SepF [Streptococcus gallolyticus]MBY5041742.1 cell division protein SepF [Streptococcus gallolyticus]
MISYFEIDDSAEYEDQREKHYPASDSAKMRIAPAPQAVEKREVEEVPIRRRSQSVSPDKSNLQRLNERQQELRSQGGFASESRTTIDIKFPKKYDEAPEIVNLLLDNISVLIDFQYMSETQARRCLDYLDGARSVLSGNLKKVSNTMWLLTPVNVTVNIEDLRSVQSSSDSDGQFDFDMRR